MGFAYIPKKAEKEEFAEKGERKGWSSCSAAIKKEEGKLMMMTTTTTC